MIRLTPGEPEEIARGYARRTIHFESDTGLADVWFLSRADRRPLADDWLVPTGLMAGMAVGEDVHIAGTVSRRLMDSMDEIQRILLHRLEGLTRIRMTADEVAPTPRAAQPLTISALSGGVDAFYTALDADQRIDEHIYLHGYEERLSDHRLLTVVLPHIRAAARELGRRLNLGESNWRDVIGPVAGNRLFVAISHLLTYGYLMGSDVTRIIAPGTCDPYFDLGAPSSFGTYVSLWSTEGLETTEHGHVSRYEKVCRVVQSDIAMRHLRVCWTKNYPRYNCHTCVKCIRTRVHLKLAGAEGRCETLPPSLSLNAVRRAHPEMPIHGNYIDESIVLAEAQGMDDLAAALRAQRDQSSDRPTRRTMRARGRRFFRRLRDSVRKKLLDVSLRRVARRRGQDHPFNYVGVDPAPD